jgi:hypothetical protein
MIFPIGKMSWSREDDNVDVVNRLNAEIARLKAQVAGLLKVKEKAVRLLNDWRPDPEHKYLDCWREELQQALAELEVK